MNDNGPAEPDLVRSERDVLLRFLNKMRNAVVAASASESLTDEQLRAPGVPSGTNLLGLIQHLTGVERSWFQLVFRGEHVDCNMSMEVPIDVTRAEVVADYRAACVRSDEIIHECPDLATLAVTPNPGEDECVALRRIIAHMIEETGRHAGHADILRELIDGATGF